MPAKQIGRVFLGLAILFVADCGGGGSDDPVADPATTSTSASTSSTSSTVSSSVPSSTGSGPSVTSTSLAPGTGDVLRAALNAARARRTEALRVDFEETENLGDARVLALRIVRGIDAYNGFIADQAWPASLQAEADAVIARWNDVRKQFEEIYDLPQDATPEDMNAHIDTANDAETAATEADEALANAVAQL
jgi:hypothetical protein